MPNISITMPSLGRPRNTRNMPINVIALPRILSCRKKNCFTVSNPTKKGTPVTIAIYMLNKTSKSKVRNYVTMKTYISKSQKISFK